MNWFVATLVAHVVAIIIVSSCPIPECLSNVQLVPPSDRVLLQWTLGELNRWAVSKMRCCLLEAKKLQSVHDIQTGSAHHMTRKPVSSYISAIWVWWCYINVAAAAKEVLCWLLIELKGWVLDFCLSWAAHFFSFRWNSREILNSDEKDF